MTPAFLISQNDVMITNVSVNVTNDSVNVTKCKNGRGANCRTFSQRGADNVSSATKCKNVMNVRSGGIREPMREKREKRSYIHYIFTFIIFFYYYIVFLFSKSEKERKISRSQNVRGITFCYIYYILTKRTQADGGGVKT
jgi:ATP-dependent Zn protease